MKNFFYIVIALGVLFATNSLVAGPDEAAKLIEAALKKLPPDQAEARQLLIHAQNALKAPAPEPVPVAPADAMVHTAEPTSDSIEIGFEKLKKSGFRLQQGPGSSLPDINPATFSFEKDIKANSSVVFGSQFFLGWSPNREVGINGFTGEEEYQGSLYFTENSVIFYEASVQGNLSTQTPDSANAWRFRVGGEIDHTNGGVYEAAKKLEDLNHTPTQSEIDALASQMFYLGSFTSFAAKYETDLNFETGRAGFELMWTPTTRLPGNGQGVKFGDVATLSWRPYAGIDAGSAVGNGNRTKFVDENLWLIARGTANLRLNFLEGLNVFDSVSLFADETYRYLADSEMSFSYLTAGINFGFNDNIGLQFDYRVGEDSPNFEEVEIVTGALSVRF